MCFSRFQINSVNTLSNGGEYKYKFHFCVLGFLPTKKTVKFELSSSNFSFNVISSDSVTASITKINNRSVLVIGHKKMVTLMNEIVSPQNRPSHLTTDSPATSLYIQTPENVSAPPPSKSYFFTGSKTAVNPNVFNFLIVK